MKKNLWTKALSMLLTLVMVVSMVPVTAISAFADGVPETLVTSLTELYSGDETRAREDLEALTTAGLLDDSGKLVDLDVREDGESVELAALSERIMGGESVGEITVNGNAATTEQIVQISQVKAAIEIAELLDEEIDVTDEHVENLENLLTGIQDGSVDLESALETGSLSLKSTSNAPLLGETGELPETIRKKENWFNIGSHELPWYYHPESAYPDLIAYDSEWQWPNGTDLNRFVPYDMHLLPLTEDGTGYIGHYFDSNGFDAHHVFTFANQDLESKEYYYYDSRYIGQRESWQELQVIGGQVGFGGDFYIPWLINNSDTENVIDKTSNGYGGLIDWEKLQYGVGRQDGQPVMTFVVPLFTTREAQMNLANISTFTCGENGKGVDLALPSPYGSTNVTEYMPNMYFSYSPPTIASSETEEVGYCDFIEHCTAINLGTRRYPAYVVSQNDVPVALATCIAIEENITPYVRRDNVEIYLETNPKASDKYLCGWDETGTQYTRREDGLGYSYFNAQSNSCPRAPRVSDEELICYIAPAVYLDKTKFVERSQEYEAADGGFLKLTNPESADFPYLYPGDPENPQNQYDLELLATEDLYQILTRGGGIIYRQKDPDLRFTWQFSDRPDFYHKKYDFSPYSNSVLTYEMNAEGEVVITPANVSEQRRSIGVVASNGGYTSYRATFPMQVISRDGTDPFLMIPRSSQTRETLVGVDTSVFFASNITQQNLSDTVFTAELYRITSDQIGKGIPEGAEPITVENWGNFPSTVRMPVTSIPIPGTALSEAGAYAVKISTSCTNGTITMPFSVTAYVKVKTVPVKIKLEKLESYAVVKDESGKVPPLKYTLESAASGVEVKYTVQPAGESVSEMIPAASSGTIDLELGEFAGTKKAYSITVYARNSEVDPWSVDSLMLTVYNEAPIKLILEDVAFGTIGGSTGGIGDVYYKNGDKITVENAREKVEELLRDYKNGDYTFDDLRSVVGLQRIISANYGSASLGVISDKLQWSSKEANGKASNDVTLNYRENGVYSDIRYNGYTYYIPASDFLMVATKDKSAESGDQPVIVTATHAATGMRTSLEVTVNTLTNKLYLFRFTPKVETYVTYENGDGETRELHSEDNGELVVYEPSGIKSDVLTMSTVNGETYAGTIQNRNLRSGEKNVVKLELYPCNNLTLVPITSQTLTFLKPDGKPYSGSVTLRAGIYKGGVYCPTFGVRTSKNEGGQIVRGDVTLTATNGETTLYYDPTQLTADNGLTRGLRYVYEYRINGYQPGYVVVDPLSDDAADSVVNLQTVRGSATAPQITRQEYQQYGSGNRPMSYTRNVIDSTENIGISSNYPKSVLYTDIALPGETVGADAAGYSTYEGADVVKFELFTDSGTKLTGQTDLSGGNVQATQITNLGQLNSAAYFVFPFSAVPMLRSTYTMTNGNMTADGITDEGSNPTPTARIKAVFTRGGMTVRSLTMPFGVTNVSHQPNLVGSNGSATEVGKEVRQNLRETTDIGSIFRSINVNDMIRKGFVFLGNLSGMGGDNLINLMILPTQDPAVFRIVAFVGANQRGGDDDDGVSVNLNYDDLAEDMSKFKKEMEELNKKKDDENDSGGSGSMQFNFYGTIILEVRADVLNGEWDIMFRGGNVGTNIKGKYEWGQTFMCGPYPAFISFETGFHADLEVAFGNKGAVRAMLLDAALGVSIEAFAGLGFDLSLVALQLGIYGQIGADVNFLLLTPSDGKPSTGTKLTIAGEIGIKLKVKLLFVSYSKKFASTGFNWTKKWANYDQIKQYWNNQGFGQLFGVTRSGRAYTMYLFDDGSTIVEIEGGAELENRDYLELAERSWTGGAASGRRLLKSAGDVTNAITNVQTNSYPYAHPAFTDDGELFLYVSDNDNANEVQSVTSYAVKSGDGYENKGRVDVNTSEKDILADLDVVASGTKDKAFAAWVKQTEMPMRENVNAEVPNDELGMMLSATEIYAGVYNDAEWTTTRLTDNFVADMAPSVASAGNRAIVAWRSMNASSMTAGKDMTAMFDVENNINYRVYDGSGWTDAQVAYNGTAGTVNAIDTAMLEDGTAILTYTVRTDEDVTSTETFYTVVNPNGSILTTCRLTNDDSIDTNAQAMALGDRFVLGWYSEYNLGETDDVKAHDIRLACINPNGSLNPDFPESISGSVDIGSDFHFSAPAGNNDLTKLSVVWTQRKDSSEEEDAGKYEMYAVRFFRSADVTGFTAPALIAETAKNYTIDRFDAYTDETGAIHAIILGTDYNTIEGIDVYDSIDLDAAAGNTVTINSSEPNNLDILDGEAISSLKLAAGTLPETAADVTANINISEVIPGFNTPVQFTVKNTGTSVLNAVTATVGGQSKEFTGLNLLPNQSTALLINYSVPEGAVSDANYTVTANGQTLGSGKLTLNRPDVGISGIKLLREENGERDIQVMLSNGSEIPLAGSGKTVKLALYKDAFYTTMIGEETTVSGSALAEIDAGSYPVLQTFQVSDLFAGAEIPEGGLTVYVKTWVEDTEEPDIYNNESFLTFTGLLERNNGELFTKDSTLEAQGDGSYIVYGDLRYNALQPMDNVIPIAVLLDSEGNEIARKNFLEADKSLKIGSESRYDLSVVFTAEELRGATPAQVIVDFAGKQTQTITAEDVNAAYGETGAKIKASTDGDGAISYAVKSGSDVLSVNNKTGALTLLKSGTAVVTVTAAATNSYEMATKDVNVTVTVGTMTVSAEDNIFSFDEQPHGITVNVRHPAEGYTVKYGTVEGTYNLDVCPTQTLEGALTVYYEVTAENYTTVTGSATVTVTAEDVLKYVNADGEVMGCVDFTTLTASDTAWSSGWYAVKEDLTIGNRISVSGDVHLILCDGATLTASNGITTTGAALYIYGQSAGTGALIANAPENHAGIGGGNSGSGGSVTINGGRITATGGEDAAGIGGGDSGSGGSFTINGGTVIATGGYNGAGIGGGYTSGNGGSSVTINGGTVTATGGSNSAGLGGGSSGNGSSVTINGGTVTAKGGGSSAGIGGGSYGNGGSVTINGGTVTAIGNNCPGIGKGYRGGNDGTVTLDEDAVVKAGSSEADATDVTGSFSASHTQKWVSIKVLLDVLPNDITLDETELTMLVGRNKQLTAAVSPDNTKYRTVSWSTSNGNVARVDRNGLVTAKGAGTAVITAATEDGGLTASCTVKVEALPAIPYLDAEGATKKAVKYTILSAESPEAAWTNGWYVVNEDLTINGRVTMSGDVNLILCDGATLTVQNGINTSGAALNIYGQTQGTGKLVANADYYTAGIGGNNGSITINSGTVIATGGSDAAGIGGGRYNNGGRITINGGTVTANGGYGGAGIGGGYSNGGIITINGGTVTATGGSNSAGIGGGFNGNGGTIIISGGTVTANGGEYGAGIGGGLNSSGGVVTISGGIVTAVGGGDGAGIGGSGRGGGGKIEISGGMVTAIGSGGAGAIGKGSQSSDNGTLTITPLATVNAGSSEDDATDVSDSFSTSHPQKWASVFVLEDVQPTGLTLNETELTMFAGRTKKLKATISPFNTKYRTVTWSTSDANVADVDEKGTVTTKGGGTAIITATTATGGLTASCEVTVEVAPTISYIDAEGTLKNTNAYITLSSNSPLAAWNNEWYAVKENITIDERITVTGDVHLILCDGATLTASHGITTTDAALHIYGQSAGTGALIANGGYNDAGIGGGYRSSGGSVTINGGRITARGGTYGAGIGGGDLEDGGSITITGGTVTAYGGESAAGIGGGEYGDCGSVTITGGTVTANGGENGAGIGGGDYGDGGNITIDGGKVTAYGGEYASAIGGGKNGNSGTLTLNAESEIVAGDSEEGAANISAGGYKNNHSQRWASIRNAMRQVINAADVNVTFGETDKKVSARVTEPAEGGGAISYAVKAGSEDYLSINASTGALTVRKVPAGGKAYVTITAARTETHARTVKDVTVTISKAAIKPSVSITGWNNTAAPNTPSVSGNTGNGNVTYSYKVKNADDSTYAAAAPTEGGEYTVRAQIAETENYLGGTATANFIVTTKPLQTVNAENVTATYGDTGVKISASVTVGDGELSYAVKSGDAVTVDGSGNLTIAKAGTAVVTVKAAETEEYAETTRDVTVTIDPKAMTVTAEDVTGFVNGHPHGITVTVTDPAEGYTVKYGTVEGTYDRDASPTKSDVGTLTVYYQVTADNYVTFTGSATLTIKVHTHEMSYAVGTGENANTITATCSADNCYLENHTARLIIAAPEGESVYTGSAIPAAIIDEDGIQNIEGVGTPTIVYKKGETVLAAAPTAAGTYTASITLENVDIGNGQTGNVTASVEYTIEKATITPTVNLENWTYGESAKTPTKSGNTGAGTETFSYKLQSEADSAYSETVPTNAGAYTVKYSVAETDNYKSGTATASFTISPRALTITAEAKSKTYGEADPALTYTHSDLVGSDTITGELSRAEGENVNTYAIGQGTLTAGDNYTITYNGANLTIHQKALTITADSDEKVYDAEALTKDTCTNTELAFNDTIESVTVSGSQTVKGESSNVPSAAVIKNGNGDNVTANYNITYTNGTLKVTEKPITITADSDTKIYDATAFTKNSYTNTDLAEGDTITSVTITGTQTNIGTTDNVPSAAVIKHGGTDVTASYAITYVNGTLEVTPKAVTITANDKTKVYDGTALTEGGFTATALESTDSHTFTVAMTSESAITNFGTQPNVIATVDGTAITTGNPTAVGNYLVTTVDGTLGITKLEIKGAIVKLDAFEFDTAVPTAEFSNDSTVAGANGTIVEGDSTKTVTYYYQSTAFLKSQTNSQEALDALTETDGVYTSETFKATTFEKGIHYVLAVISGDNYSNTYATQSVFEVKQNTDKERTAPTAPTVDGTKVTVDEADRAKSLEYSLDGTTWKPVTLNENGEFTAEWANPVTDAEMKLRETADEKSYAKPSASATGTATITTTTFTVTYDANGGVKAPDAVTVTSDRTATVSGKANMTRKGYTFKTWNTSADGSGTEVKAGDKLTSGTTLYAQWKPNTYKVRFNANGGNGTMGEELEFTYDVAQALTENAFARDDYSFLGWSLTANGSVQYQDKQSVKNLAENGTVTLYAVWAKELYNISGTIKSAQTGNITLQLVQGSIAFGESETVEYTTAETEVNFALNGVPAGTYNLVATQGDVTMTAVVLITDDHVALELIEMPSGNASSVIDIKSAETPAIVVGGLDKLAEDEIVEDRKVKVAIAIEAQNETQAGEAGEAIANESRAQNAEFIDFTVTKTITNKNVEESVETMTETSEVLELVIPFNFSGKSGIKLYRFHNGEVQSLEQAKGDEFKDGTYSLDQRNGFIHVFTRKFSTYAITYSNYSNYSGSSVPDFETVIAETEHGTITVEPEKAKAGDEVVITATPDAGYKLAELTVKDANGKAVSVTKVNDTTYTFTQPDGAVTVDVTFKPAVNLSRFVDVDATAWYADSIRWAIENGVMNGVSPKYFNPDGDTTRAMVATMLWRLEGSPVVSGEMKFVDVAEGTWYTEAVRWAASTGIITGSKIPADTTPWPMGFRPDDAVTREQLAAMLYRYAQYKKADVSASASLSNYGDAQAVSSWATSAMQWAVGSGIINGVGSDLAPAGNATRAQVATMLMRYSTAK